MMDGGSIDRVPGDGSAARRRRVLFVTVTALVVVSVIVAFRAVLLPFVLGTLLAYVLHPVVTTVARVQVRAQGFPAGWPCWRSTPCFSRALVWAWPAPCHGLRSRCGTLPQ